MCSSNMVVEVGAVVVVEVVPVEEADAVVLERGRDLLGEDRRPGASTSSSAPGADRAELVGGVEAVGRRGAEPGRDLLLEAGDPHLEELVEVRR